MRGKNSNQCKISVIELEDGYQVEITGGNIKDIFQPENLKKCIENCCCGEAPFQDSCCG